ncbi:FAD-dependent monooxygenase [Leifsonia sp. YAF41]|uniref:FAD-dependent monooxygenase n=1 Tax=Leifsonia sp. YAF41 TaxID=3233086 RepID=UPI003F9802CB
MVDPDEADVVIVGAGPVGLMLACELGRSGIRALVLEKESEPDAMPKGNGLVGEIANVLRKRGLLHGQKGLRVLPVPRYSFGVLTLRLNPFRANPLRVLPVPQRRLEELLAQRAVALGAHIRRGHAVAEFNDEGDRVTVTVESDEGAYAVTTRFLAGCDGAHSFIRHRLGVAFPGITSDQLARIGRVTIPASALRRRRNIVTLEHDRQLMLFQPQHTAAGVFTMAPVSDLDRNAPKDLYLVGTQEPRNEQESATEISLDEFRASISRVLGFDLPISSGEWLRSTVANSRQAERYRVGRVLLAGDAAHVFSAGGSSLNTGMLDAVDLASRLVAVLVAGAEIETLEDYHVVRHAAGWRTILQTRAQAALSEPGANADALRLVLGNAFRARNAHRYLATLLIGGSRR